MNDLKGNRSFVAECLHNDCNIRVSTHELFMPGVLLPEFEHRLGSQRAAKQPSKEEATDASPNH